MKTVNDEELKLRYNLLYHNEKPFTGICIDYECRTFLKDGMFHRDDGPAMIYDDGEVEFWLNDLQYTIDDWANIVGIRDTEEFVLLKLQYG